MLLTSREKPKEIARLEDRTPSIRSSSLDGLALGEAREFVEQIRELSGSDEDWQKLIKTYQSNPLYLDLAAKHIDEVYGGNISDFLNDRKQVFDDLRDCLDEHYERLSEPEKEVMYWLAINRDPISLSELREDLLLPEAKTEAPQFSNHCNGEQL